MKTVRSAITLVALAALAACSGADNSSDSTNSAAPITATAPFSVKIIGFNDFHGNLESPGTFGQTAASTDKPPVGGADYLAAYIARLKAQNRLNLMATVGVAVACAIAVAVKSRYTNPKS